MNDPVTMLERHLSALVRLNEELLTVVRRRRQAIADLYRPGFVGESLQERLHHAAFNEHPAGGRARLAGETESGLGDQVRGQIQIRIGQHDRGILAPHFHLGARHAGSKLLVDPVTNGMRTGER